MMSEIRKVWIDSNRCTGCGACVEVCAVGAITLVDGKARVDEMVCSGCEACLDVCPEDAIQPVIQGELVLAHKEMAPTVQRSTPLAQMRGAAVAPASVGLLAKAAGTIAQVVDHWLTQPSKRARTSTAKAPFATKGRGTSGRGRRTRHRRRGR